MKAFLDKIIEYLDKKFSEDTALVKKPRGHYAYEFGLVPSVNPYYEVQNLSGSDGDEDFENLVTLTIGLQINVYGVKANVNNKIVSAQVHSMILADKCEEFMQEFKYADDTVVSMRRIVRSPAIPYEDGSKSYTTAIRYEIEIKQ